MQRRRHVDAGVVFVGAFEADIFGAHVGPYPLQKGAERSAAPLSDRAPTLDADMTGDLAGLRQSSQHVDRPWPLVFDQPRNLEPVVRPVDDRRLILGIVGVERERPGQGAFRIGRREPIGVEQRRLHLIVPARHPPQHAIDEIVVGAFEIAAGQERHGAERQRLAQKKPSLHLGERRPVVGQAISGSSEQTHQCSPSWLEARPVIIVGRVDGTIATSARCTATKPTIPAIIVKWTMRAVS